MKPNEHLHTIELEKHEVLALGLPLMGPDILMSRIDTVILRAHERLREIEQDRGAEKLYGDAQREALQYKARNSSVLRSIIKSADEYLPKLTADDVRAFWEDPR